MRELLWILGLVLFAGMVYGVESDEACNTKGFNYTVSTWVWNDAYIEVGSLLDYQINVSGYSKKANWSSNQNIDGVVYKSGSRTYLLDGGLTGTVPKTVSSNNISFIVFCTNQIELIPDQIETNNQVPEFGMFGMLMAVLGTLFIITKNLED